jgi:hypothetical protein
MTIHGAVLFLVAILLASAALALPQAGERPVVLAGATGGVCTAQFEKCMARCRGSGVCTQHCTANDRACRAGGKPVFR